MKIKSSIRDVLPALGAVTLFLKYVSSQAMIDDYSEIIKRGGVEYKSAEALSKLASKILEEDVPVEDFINTTDESLDKISEQMKERDESLGMFETYLKLNKKEVEDFYKEWKQEAEKQWIHSVAIVSSFSILNNFINHTMGLVDKGYFKIYLQGIKNYKLFPSNIFALTRKVLRFTSKLLYEFLRKQIEKYYKEGADIDANWISLQISLLPLSFSHSEIEQLFKEMKEYSINLSLLNDSELEITLK
jgi:hypothetical protein|nr:MAG TPA: hypothetical protein [Caudoviricetes sp.]